MKKALAKWVGGKNKIANKIIPYIKPGIRYIEVCAGMGSVFSNIDKKNYKIFVLNDIDRDIVNLYRVLQDKEKFEILNHIIKWTPYSHEEFKKAIDIGNNRDKHTDIEMAWAMLVKFNMGFAGIAKTYGNWGKEFNSNSLSSAWHSKKDNFVNWHEMLQNVYIECKDAIDLIEYWDGVGSSFYIDPPYIQNTRISNRIYNHEQQDDFHIKLVNKLLDIRGDVVLSCYDHEIYHPLLNNGWKKIQFNVSNSVGSRARGTSLHGGVAPRRIETIYVKEEL